MSLILDALRKSEAERRRGQAPDLFASLPAPTAPRPGGLSRWWPALVLGGLLLGAGFVFWHGRTAAPANDLAVGADASSVSDPDAPLPMVVSAPAPASSAPTLGNAPATALWPPPAASATVASTPPVSAPSAAPVASASALGAAATAATPARVAAAPRPAPMVVNTPPPAAALPPAPISVAPAATAADGEDAGDENLPPIAILAASERAALPPLKLSMHVWNSEPGKRFAIIDGHRVTEGSSAGGSIIEQIRRDGVVLNINGRRVLLPRP